MRKIPNFDISSKWLWVLVLYTPALCLFSNCIIIQKKLCLPIIQNFSLESNWVRLDVWLEAIYSSSSVHWQSQTFISWQEGFSQCFPPPTKILTSCSPRVRNLACKQSMMDLSKLGIYIDTSKEKNCCQRTRICMITLTQHLCMYILLGWCLQATSDGPSEAALNACSEASRAQGINLRDRSGPKFTSDQHLGLQIASNCYQRSPWILQFGADCAGIWILFLP